MPDAPISANTEDLAVTEYDAQGGADAVDEKDPGLEDISAHRSAGSRSCSEGEGRRRGCEA